MSLPKIEINFYQYATTAIARSAKGVVCIVLKDEVSTTLAKHTFTSALNVTGLSETNIALVKQAFLGKPIKVIVITVPATFEEAVPMLNTSKFNWLVSPIVADQADVVAYAKEKGCKAVVYQTPADDMHIINFKNASVTLANGTTQAGSDYIVRIAGLQAGLPFTQSATYYILTDLKAVSAVDEPAEGEYYLFNDGDETIRVARAVNSLTTLTENIGADLQKITIVECLDIIRDDIRTEFKDNYLGKYKNKIDNQFLFISAVNSYYRQLAKEDLLDINYPNKCDVDVVEQRSAWIASGKTEAENWTDAQVRTNTYKYSMFLTSSVKVLDAIEDMIFNVNLF